LQGEYVPQKYTLKQYILAKQTTLFCMGPWWLYWRFSCAKWVRKFCKWWWLLILNFIFARVHTQNEVVHFACQSIFNVNSIISKDVVVITVTLTPSPSISSLLSIFGKFTLFNSLNMPYTKLCLTQTMLQKHSYNVPIFVQLHSWCWMHMRGGYWDNLGRS